MQRARQIFSYLLIALVLSFSVRANCVVFAENHVAPTNQSTTSFNTYLGLESLYIHSTDNATHAPLVVKHLKSVALLRKVVLLTPTQQFYSTQCVARNLLLQQNCVAYVIYPFHDFL